MAERAYRPAEELAQQYKEEIGIGKPMGFLAPSSPKKAQYGQGLSNQEMIDAIDRRALRTHKNVMSGLSRKADVDALNNRFNKLNQAAALTSAEIQHNEQVNANRRARRDNRRRARGSVLGNILGLVGAAGGAMVGGPAGAMAGYSVGQGVGQMAGGQ